MTERGAPTNPAGAWARWLREPRSLAFRKGLFQIHLWSGLALGLYVFFISITGSILVYRNELQQAAQSQSAMRAVTWLMEVHEDFLLGRPGEIINGSAAAALLLIIASGLVLWWPGVGRWQRALRIRTHVGWRRLVWDLHGMLGVWTFAASFIFALSGIYLCFPESFHAFADWLQPGNASNAGERLVDWLLYWLAFLHFGRINGIGIFCDGAGLCDQAVKATWALFGLAPAAMFVTGAVMWWNRVLRRSLARLRAS
jgi:uncharacterized iron-regulated membrane protein